MTVSRFPSRCLGAQWGVAWARRIGKRAAGGLPHDRLVGQFVIAGRFRRARKVPHKPGRHHVDGLQQAFFVA